jgi:hypothetical protein
VSDSSSPIAVLTGDLVKSREAGSEAMENAIRILSATAHDLSEMTDADTRFTRFRGDGWQLVLRSAGWALRACLLIMADLRASGIGVDTRISAGLGRYDSLGTTNLSDATGPAFFVSGHHLDLAPKRRRLLVAGGREQDQPWQTAIFDLIEHQVSGWTPPQAKAVAMALRDGQMTQADIADDLGITRQAVQIRLAGAGYAALENALRAFEQPNWNDLHA